MTEIIATVGQMIASETEINKFLEKKVTNYWINYGLKRNSFVYISLLNKIKMKSQVPLAMYLELPGSRCRHVKQIGEILEDNIYMLYDENAKRNGEKNCMIMSGLCDIIDDLEIGEKIYYEDGLCICSIRQIDKEKKRVLISCDISCDASMISEGTAVSFNGVDKSYEVIRQKDKDFLEKLRKERIVPDFFVVSFCRDRNDVKTAKNKIAAIFNQDIRLLVKIQSRLSVENIDEIIDCAEGIVVERGDLIYTLNKDYYLPCVQRMIIEKAKEAKKISIVASGFMSEFSRTSIMNRSEQSDVYRLKEEGADYLLLTKETGKAPHAFATINAIQNILQSR